jgi:hypothetical protein
LGRISLHRHNQYRRPNNESRPTTASYRPARPETPETAPHLTQNPEQITEELKARASKVKKKIARLEKLKRVSHEVMRMRCCAAP